MIRPLCIGSLTRDILFFFYDAQLTRKMRKILFRGIECIMGWLQHNGSIGTFRMLKIVLLMFMSNKNGLFLLSISGLELFNLMTCCNLFLKIFYSCKQFFFYDFFRLSWWERFHLTLGKLTIVNMRIRWAEFYFILFFSKCDDALVKIIAKWLQTYLIKISAFVLNF